MPDGHSIGFRRSARARRMQVRVCPVRGAEVVMPRRTPQWLARRFADRHRDWIEERLGELRRQLPDGGDPAPPREMNLPLVGEHWRIRYEPADGAAGVRSPAAGELVVPAGITDQAACRELLRRWLKRRGREALIPRLRDFADRFGIPVNRVQVRNQATRWGSCSSRGTISLNARLLFLETRLVRYLMIHELAHVRHPNHGPAFWRTVGEMDPDWREADRALSRAWRIVPTWVQSG